MRKFQIPQKLAALLVYGRPPLVFGGLVCAIGVMWNRSPVLYTLGTVLLFISMCFDLIDGWFSERFNPDSPIAYLADRIMDKLVYAMIFPLVAVGAMWRLMFISPDYSRIELLHAIFILLLCVTVLIRDSFAQFLRGFAVRKGQEPEPIEFTRLRTIVAAPVSVLLYAVAFYVPEGPQTEIYTRISWLGNLPLRGLFFIEIIFLVINFGSIAGYCRKYGKYCLDELCEEDEHLRRSILSLFPNALTAMNAIMGLLAVFFAYQERIREAYLLIIGAALFDKLDGAVARKLGLTEPPPSGAKKRKINLGAVLDDISDAISFCIVPAWIYAIVFGSVDDAWLVKLPFAGVAVFYVISGIVRLLYFTLDKHPIPGFFKGLPTPAAALLVTAPLIIFHQALGGAAEWIRFWGIFCFLLILIASVLMNAYPLHYLHMGRFMSRKPSFSLFSMFLLLIFVLTPYFGHVAFLYLFFYVLSPIVTWRIDPSEAAAERPLKPARADQG